MEKVTLECLECGKVFKKSIKSNYVEARCPKCGSVDIDLSIWNVPIVRTVNVVVKAA